LHVQVAAPAAPAHFWSGLQVLEEVGSSARQPSGATMQVDIVVEFLQYGPGTEQLLGLHWQSPDVPHSWSASHSWFTVTKKQWFASWLQVSDSNMPLQNVPSLAAELHSGGGV
jgi:hypothetical protein